MRKPTYEQLLELWERARLMGGEYVCTSFGFALCSKIEEIRESLKPREVWMHTDAIDRVLSGDCATELAYKHRAIPGGWIKMVEAEE